MTIKLRNDRPVRWQARPVLRPTIVRPPCDAAGTTLAEAKPLATAAERSYSAYCTDWYQPTGDDSARERPPARTR